MRKLRLTLLLAVTVAIGAAGQEVGQLWYRCHFTSSDTVNGVVCDTGNATITATTDTGSYDPNITSYFLRLYKNNLMTIAARDGKAVTRVEFEFNTGYAFSKTYLTLSSGTYDDVNEIWTGCAPVVTFKPTMTDGARYISKITVYTVDYDAAAELGAPLAVPVPGYYTTAQSVALSTPYEDASIYYTLDGSEPTTGSSLYSSPLSLSANTTLKSVADLGATMSPVSAGNYTFLMDATPQTSSISVGDIPECQTDAKVTGFDIGNLAHASVKQLSGAAPYYSKASGVFYFRLFSKNTLTIKALSPKDRLSRIKFTTRSNDFTTSTLCDSGSFTCDATGHTATWTGCADEVTFWIGGTVYVTDIEVDGYVMSLKNPELSLAPGTYMNAQPMTITCSTAGADLYYTLDGSDPTTASTLYAGTFNLDVDGAFTVKAIAAKDGEVSDVVSADYYIYQNADLVTVSVDAPSLLGVKYTSNSQPLTTEYLEDLATIEWSQGSNTSTAPYYYKDPDAFRMLQGNEMTIRSSYPSNLITSVRITNPGTGSRLKNTDYSTPAGLDVSADDVATWDGFTDALTITKDYSSTAQISNVAVTLLLLEPVAPRLSLEPGLYLGEQTLALESVNADGAIYYTLDGSEPTTASTLYTGPLTLDADVTVKAIVAKFGKTSPVTTGVYRVFINPDYKSGIYIYSEHKADYTDNQELVGTATPIDGQANIGFIASPSGSKPWFYGTGTTSVGTARISNNASITLNGIPDNAAITKIVLHTNGTYNFTAAAADCGEVSIVSDASAADSPYVFGSTCAEWRGVAHDVVITNTSGTTAHVTAVEVTYILQQVDAPTFSPEPGIYIGEQTVAINSINVGAAIYYTLDGTEPTTASTLYTAPLTLDADVTVKAIAVKNGETSPVATADYRVYPDPQLKSGIYIYNDHKADYENNLSLIDVVKDIDGEVAFTYALGTAGTTPYFYGEAAASISTARLYNGSSIIFNGIDDNAVITKIVLHTNGDCDFTALSADSGEVAVVSDASADDSPYVYGSTCAEWNGLSRDVVITNIGGNGKSGYVTAIEVTYILQKILAPTFSIEPGAYNHNLSVEIAAENRGAVIHYTLDGSEPTTESTLYADPIEITEPTTIKAIADVDGETGPVAEGYFNVVAGYPSRTYSFSAEDAKAIFGSTQSLDAKFAVGEYVDMTFNTQAYVVCSSSPYIRHSYHKNLTLTAKGDDDIITGVKIHYLSQPAAGVEPDSGTATLTEVAVDPEDDSVTEFVDVWEGAARAVTFYNPNGQSVTINDVSKSGSTQIRLIEVTYALNGVKTPVISAVPATYPGEVPVTMVTANPDASIYYTLDGTEPTAASTLYTGPISITEDAELRAVAELDGVYSPMASADYTVVPADEVETVVFGISDIAAAVPNNTAIAGFNLDNNVRVNFTDVSSSGAPKYLAITPALYFYTPDEAVFSSANEGDVITRVKMITMPSYSFSLGYVSASEGAVEALGYDAETGTSSMQWRGNVASVTISDVVTPLVNGIEIDYIPVVKRPQFSDEEGTYDKGIDISITHEDPSAVIYYTLDGTEPTVESTPYTEPIILNDDTTIKALAVVDGKTSPVAKASYAVFDTTGIESVSPEADADGPVRYYDLRGVAVDRPGRGEVYIRVAGGTASKVVIK